MLRTVVFPVLLFLSHLLCTSQTVGGIVFHDKNVNGVPDRGEKGLKGILVSNGDTIVRTDRHGSFHIKCPAGSSVFPILPDNYSFPGGQILNANFFFAGTDSVDTFRQVNFGLTPKRRQQSFSINAIGDVQVGDRAETDYAGRTLFAELLNDTTTTFHLYLGDLVNDKPDLLPLIGRMIAQTPKPAWTVIGNHDRSADSIDIRRTAAYNRLFGADTYAFNEGNVHFIVLNNVYGTGKRSYEGRISDRQLRFLSNDLRHVGQGQLIVLSMHIPLAWTANKDELIRLLAGRGQVLLLTGHTHQVGRSFFEGDRVTIHELGVGASCGFWWVGEKDWEGVPSALMQDGSPRCYFVLDFHQNQYQLRFKGIGIDAAKQMNIWVAGSDSTDILQDGLSDKRGDSVLITVFGASDSTQVQCRFDDGEWLPCTKVAELDANIARMRRRNEAGIYPTKHSRRNPLRQIASPHIWAIAIPESCRNGVHTITVQAQDRFGFSAKGARSYGL